MSTDAGWSEKELKTTILSVCKEYDLIVNHHRVNQHSTLGWPDLEIVGPGGILYRELKTMVGVLSVDQRRIGSKLIAAGANWSVWRPVDWGSGIILVQLQRILD